MGKTSLSRSAMHSNVFIMFYGKRPHFMRSLDESLILNAFNFDVNAQPKALKALRYSKRHAGVNLSICNSILLASLSCDELQGTQEACWTRWAGKSHEKKCVSSEHLRISFTLRRHTYMHIPWQRAAPGFVHHPSLRATWALRA